MGSYCSYEGDYKVPDNKKKQFAQQMLRILDLGGMMGATQVNMFDTELSLLRPVREMSDNKLVFYYNYFEDRCWETATFDQEECVLTSNKVGSAEFGDVMEAAYMLYEVYDPQMGFSMKDIYFVSASRTLGWINQILDTDFSMGKRAKLWSCIEASASSEYSHQLTTETLRDLIPFSRRIAAGGTDLADLLYAINGTETLNKDTVQKGTYPANVLKCKQALESYLHGINDTSTDTNATEQKLEPLWDLLTKPYDKRKEICDERKEIAQLTLCMPARVFVYLTAELLQNGQRNDDYHFLKFWEALSSKVYHDEKMAEYASKRLKDWRKERMEEPFYKFTTCEYLRQDGYFTFYPPVPELKGTPNYYISDADRLFWWDGTEEVTISDKTDEWLKELAKQYQELLTREPEESDVMTVFRDFMHLLGEINHYYFRLHPFESMFNEFVAHLSSKEYRAAIQLIRQLSENEEIREAGKIVQTYASDLENKNILENAGRLQIRRLYALLANPKLRKKYFGF